MVPEDSFELAADLPPMVLAAAIEALGLGAEAREASLAALRAAHPELEPQLRRMSVRFAAVERLLAGGFGSGAESPTHIGPYRVVRRLGDGAFGEVFLCEQVEPVRRDVAIKLLRAGAGDRTTMLRFAAERQLIASLQHPAIAQVFDAGTLADGRPFFVMDAIDGAPIDRYCDEHALTVDERLELFCELCRGAQHAHDRGIVHRDLKPANVLVVEVDGRPRPKIIDFGIAKVLQGSTVPRSFDTEAGRVVGTPGYMSPEQQRGASDDVDARADVFGLGVMLYQLLCGELPWPAGAAATDTDPQRPSTRVSEAAAKAGEVARDRSTEHRRLAGRLRGDLDWIVLKCLQRDRANRYPSAQELIDDLERHRRAEPVRAGPPTTRYRLQKFVRRHRAAVLSVGVVATVVISGLAIAVYYGRTSRAEIDAATSRAEASFADASAAVARLLERANDPALREAPQGDAARESMLRDALTFYDRFLRERPTDPELRARRCRTLLGLSNVHWLIGDAPRATEAAQEAVQESEALHAGDPTNIELHGLWGEALCRQGVARSLAGDHAGAWSLLRAAADQLAPCAAVSPARFGRLHAIALRGAATSTTSNEERVAMLGASVQLLDSLRAIEPPVADLANDYVLTSCMLGDALRMAGKLSESASVGLAAAAELPKVTADRLHLTYRVQGLLARVALERGAREVAIGHWRAALAAATEWEQAQPNRWLPKAVRGTALHQLGYALNYAGEFDASARCYHESIAVHEALLERFPSDGRREELVEVLEEFAQTLLDRFRREVLADAAACIDRAVAVDAARAASGAPGVRWILLGLQASIAAARIAGGGDDYWPALETALASEPDADRRDKVALVGAHAGLARWHLDHGRLDAAAAALERAEAWIARDPEYFADRSTVEIGTLQARLAAARADHAACARAADRVLAARSTWYGRRFAAECLYLAWRCAGEQPNAASEAAAYRARALDWFGQVKRDLDDDVAQHGDDPWFVLPWGMACIRMAELAAAAGDEGTAVDMLAAGLPRLEAVRSEAPADLWDEAAYANARVLQGRLGTQPR